MNFLQFLRRLFPWFVRHYNRLEVRGIHNLPKKGSAVIAPNHSGGFDWDNFSLMSALDHFKTNNPARKRIWLCYWDVYSVETPIFAPWVQQFSPIPVSLTGKGIPYDLTDKIVKRGELMAIMPEGHSASIKEGYQLWKFYPGAIKLHLRYKIPLIPTAIIGMVRAAPIWGSDYNPKSVPPWESERFMPFVLPRKMIIHFGKPVFFDKYYDMDVDKATQYKLASELRKEARKVISIYRKGTSIRNPYGKKVKNSYKRKK